MDKVTKDDVSKANREWVEAQNKYNALLTKSTLVFTSDYKSSDIALAEEKAKTLHRRYNELVTLYVGQRKVRA